MIPISYIDPFDSYRTQGVLESQRQEYGSTGGQRMGKVTVVASCGEMNCGNFDLWAFGSFLISG
jgi:hypothetical protein